MSNVSAGFGTDWRSNLNSRPRLSVSILTRNSEPHLARLIAEAANYADEVIVGVDVSSTDGSFQVASEFADVVYRFRLSGQLAPARMLPFDYASGDWILSLDDDESIEESFDELLPDLLTDPRITHYYFPRKWLVNLNPPEFVEQSPWYPNKTLRLFRNDRRIVWNPPGVHSGYRVEGVGCFETRASILHYEPLWCSPEWKLKKLEVYRDWGSKGEAEEYYFIPETAQRKPAKVRGVLRPRADAPRRVIHPDVRDAAPVTYPPWSATFIRWRIPQTGPSGATLTAEVLVRNSGRLAWCPPHSGWPTLQVGFHVLDDEGRVLRWDGDRTPVPRFVEPDEEALIIATFQAPPLPGDYTIEWDLVSEGECWFAECGSPTLKTPFHVTA